MERLMKKRFYATKKNLCLLLAFFSTYASCTPAIAQQPTSEWTVLVFVQANNNLSSFALKNFSDMATVGSNANTTTLVQWYQPNQHGIWRYKVEKGKMALSETSAVESHGNSKQDLVDAMRWAVTKFPAKKYALILWDHGIGILDPIWGKHNSWNTKEGFAIDQDVLALCPRIQIDGLTYNKFTLPGNEEDYVDADNATIEMLCDMYDQMTHRGILFNEQSRTYMDSASLSQALAEIQQSVLGGKKLDLLGMDACLMAMLEVSYLARNHANYLVASQEVELAHGWNYLGLSQCLANPNITAEDVAKNIVSTYQHYYKDKIQFYTQSAIKLDHIDSIKTNLDALVVAYKNSPHQERTFILDIIKKARRSCLQFSASSYVDLYTLYGEILKGIADSPATILKQRPSITTIKTALENGLKQIDQSVIANTAGKNLSRARGLSIYFPAKTIDASYLRNNFAQECLWLDFLQDICPQL